MEIEQRLGLYRVFLKLYEYHRSLLDEILQLEKTGHKTFSRLTIPYVTGVLQGQRAYLISNLVDGKTQTLLQPQGIWTIGRDRTLAISIPDRHLSRYHAVIQYIHNQGFYLVDLNSTNGSFVNSEPVHGSVLLKDGDRIRISSLAFPFFLCCDTPHILGTPPSKLLAQLQSLPTTPPPQKVPSSNLKPERLQRLQQAKSKESTDRFLAELSELEEPAVNASTPQFSLHQRSEILDRFFRQQAQKTNEPN